MRKKVKERQRIEEVPVVRLANMSSEFSLSRQGWAFLCTARFATSTLHISLQNTIAFVPSKIREIRDDHRIFGLKNTVDVAHRKGMKLKCQSRNALANEYADSLIIQSIKNATIHAGRCQK